MDKLAQGCAIFIATVIGTLEKMGALDRVMESLWRANRKIMQPEIVQAAKPNEDDDAFIKSAEADGWGRDMPRTVHP